ncbi:MAG: hypothetical protein AAGF24_08140, partial [Cyanobacteria bacterium P01_H01_bin.121]
MENSYRVDPERWARREEWPETHCPIRAYGTDNKLVDCDIIHLDRASLLAWFKSRGGDHPELENLTGILLGHPGGLHDEQPMSDEAARALIDGPGPVAKPICWCPKATETPGAWGRAPMQGWL